MLVTKHVQLQHGMLETKHFANRCSILEKVCLDAAAVNCFS